MKIQIADTNVPDTVTPSHDEAVHLDTSEQICCKNCILAFLGVCIFCVCVP